MSLTTSERAINRLVLGTAAIDGQDDLFRFGGGAGQIDFSLPSKDTDPNTIDVIVSSGQSQRQVLDWTTSSPVQLPIVPLGP